MSAPQLPMLCRTCGGPSTPTDAGEIVCAYCGALDRLPAAELDRMLELRRRVTVAANATLQLAGRERSLALIFEGRAAFWRVSAMWFAFVPVVIRVHARRIVVDDRPDSQGAACRAPAPGLDRPGAAWWGRPRDVRRLVGWSTRLSPEDPASSACTRASPTGAACAMPCLWRRPARPPGSADSGACSARR